MVPLSVYSEIVSDLDELTQILDSEFERPVPVIFGEGFVFRHHAHLKSDVLASHLKLVRVVSLLNASICLMEKGYVQEVYIFCRAIDEAVEETTFLALPDNEINYSSKQIKMLKEFYQEQFSDLNDFKSSIPRDRVGRRDIRAAISKIPVPAADPHTRNTIAKSIYEVFSGFVHGSYVHIMEMYGGINRKFYTKGMLGTPLMDDCIKNFASYICRAAMMAELVAARVGRQDLILRSLKLVCNLAETTGCLDDEAIQSLRGRILNFGK